MRVVRVGMAVAHPVEVDDHAVVVAGHRAGALVGDDHAGGVQRDVGVAADGGGHRFAVDGGERGAARQPDARLAGVVVTELVR